MSMTDEDIKRAWFARRRPAADGIYTHHLMDFARQIELAAAQAERHRIYAALEADPGALWRDQGFQEWRSKRNGAKG